MPNCAAYGCSKTSGGLISIHRFPADPETRRSWINFVNLKRQNWTPTASSVLCSLHFTEDCYEVGDHIRQRIFRQEFKTATIRKLKIGSVPTIEAECFRRSTSSILASKRQKTLTKRNMLKDLLFSSKQKAPTPGTSPVSKTTLFEVAEAMLSLQDTLPQIAVVPNGPESFTLSVVSDNDANNERHVPEIKELLTATARPI